MRRLLPYMKKYWSFALLSPLLMILEVISDIAIPYLMSRIVDIGIANRDVDYVIKIGIIMIIAAFFAMLFGVISAYAGAKAGYG